MTHARAAAARNIRSVAGGRRESNSSERIFRAPNASEWVNSADRHAFLIEMKLSARPRCLLS